MYRHYMCKCHALMYMYYVYVMSRIYWNMCHTKLYYIIIK